MRCDSHCNITIQGNMIILNVIVAQADYHAYKYIFLSENFKFSTPISSFQRKKDVYRQRERN